MTRKEFEKIILEITLSYNLPECPPDIKNGYWERAKHHTPDEVKEELIFYFKTAEKLSEFEMSMLPQSEAEHLQYSEDLKQFKEEIKDLLKRLLDKSAGHTILRETAEHFDLNITFDKQSVEEIKESIRQAELTAKKDNKDFVCPDAITPDILKILKGESRDK